MRAYLLLTSSLAVMSLFTACESINPHGSQNNQFASSNQDIIELQNDVARLKQKVTNLQNSNAIAVKNFTTLQNQISYVNEQNQQQNKTIASLRQMLVQERAARQAAMKNVVKTVADQTARTVNSIAIKQRQTAKNRATSTSTAPAGAYYKHKVGPGETLSAIARAYKVSVKDIKKSNRLKSDVIRVGQTLHIPKK